MSHVHSQCNAGQSINEVASLIKCVQIWSVLFSANSSIRT